MFIRPSWTVQSGEVNEGAISCHPFDTVDLPGVLRIAVKSDLL